MDCERIEDTLVRGGTVDPRDPDVAEHLRGCESCRFLVEDDPGLARALAPPPEPPVDVAPLRRELELSLAGERGALPALRALPRWARIAIFVAALGLELAFFAIWMLREDFAEYPAARMGLLVAGFAALAIVAGWHALRPLYVPPAPVWASRALVGMALLWPVLVALLPEVPTIATEPFSHPANAYYCIVDGGGLAIALLLLARALDRGGHGATDRALAAAVAGGAAGLLGLQLQCPFNYPLHLALGHASIPALFLAGTLMFSRFSR